MTERAPYRLATTPLVAAFSLGTMAWYGLFVFSPVHAGHPIAYGLLLVSEFIGMTQLLGVWLTILIAPQPETPVAVARNREALAHAVDLPVSVAAFITVAGEPIEVIRDTASAARDMLLPHRTFILDDGNSDDVAFLAQELGVEYIRRDTREGWKAGNLNNAFELLQPDFVAIFDSDHAAKPEFLLETLPYLLADEKLAFIQTPQHFNNTDGFISGGSAQTQEVFYRHIQAGKNAFNSAFYVGTNVLFRGDAIRDLGGFYDQSHSEDIWTALLLHERGWKSFYLPKVLASGHAPETVGKYFRQQYRWATGGFEIFFRRNPLFRKGLSLDQRLQYLHSSMFFLSGFSIFILFLLPLLYVYFGWRAIDAPNAWEWAVRFFPYYLMTFASAAHFMGQPIKWRTIVVALTPFPSHIAAFFTVLTGIRVRWSVTGVIRKRTDYVKSVAPHLLLLLLSLGAIPIALFQEDKGIVLSAMTVFWLCWNSAILLSICKRAFPRYARSPIPGSVLSARSLA